MSKKLLIFLYIIIALEIVAIGDLLHWYHTIPTNCIETHTCGASDE